MFPSLSEHYHGNYLLSTAESVGNGLLCHSICSHASNFKDFMVFEPRVPHTFSPCLSSFVVSIFVVIGSSTKEQMRRIAATWHVARMANKKTARNWADMHRVGKTMRFFERLRFRVECSVSIFVGVPGPKPTSVFFGRFCNLAQKSIVSGHKFFEHASSVHQTPFASKALS
jgi:hypothetical protein